MIAQNWLLKHTKAITRILAPTACAEETLSPKRKPRSVSEKGRLECHSHRHKLQDRFSGPRAVDVSGLTWPRDARKCCKERYTQGRKKRQMKGLPKCSGVKMGLKAFSVSRAVGFCFVIVVELWLFHPKWFPMQIFMALFAERVAAWLETVFPCRVVTEERIEGSSGRKWSERIEQCGHDDVKFGI